MPPSNQSQVGSLSAETTCSGRHHSLFQGSRINMTASRVRAQCLPDSSDAVYATAVVDNILVGNVFACRWRHNGRNVLWITQLVVSSDFRRKGVATRIMESLVQDEDEIFGILSSHPAALKALSRAFGGRCTEPVRSGYVCSNVVQTCLFQVSRSTSFETMQPTFWPHVQSSTSEMLPWSARSLGTFKGTWCLG